MLLNNHINEIQKIVGKYSDLHKKIKQDHSDWDAEDPRVALVGRTANVLITQLVDAYVFATCVINKKWWEIYIPGVPKDNIQRQADSYVAHNKISNYLLFFSFFESDMRRLYRKIYPGKQKDGTGHFYHIYSDILKYSELTKYTEFLRFCKEIRNLIHNNGVYFNCHNKQCAINFRGESYNFTYGKSVDFLYAELIFRIYDEMVIFMRDLISSEKIME